MNSPAANSEPKNESKDSEESAPEEESAEAPEVKDKAEESEKPKAKEDQGKEEPPVEEPKEEAVADTGEADSKEEPESKEEKSAAEDESPDPEGETKSEAKVELPEFSPGDTVKVHLRVKEGDRERMQVFEGMVISKRGSKKHKTFTVRKISFGVGVEKIFPECSPVIAKLEVVSKGDVRRAKLYYLRDRVGKSAKVKQKRDN